MSEIIKTLTNILDKYKFPIMLVNQYKIKPNEQVSSKTEKNSPKITKNNLNDKENPQSIIDSIVDLDDINLLTNVYNNQMTFKSTDLNEIDFPKSSITAFEFLKYLEAFQVEEKIRIKENWLIKLGNDFENLLDDIISCHADKYATNDMDCY